MKLFEYMGKELFRGFGLPVPQGRVVTTPAEAAEVAAELGSVVLKAQILSGKRGKAGGIKFAETPAEAEAAAAELLRSELRGLIVDHLLVEQKLVIEHEYYLAITVDGASRGPVILASAAGGMDIEEVPDDQITRLSVDVAVGVGPYLGREVARRLGLRGEAAKQAASLVVALYQAFKALDAELVEVNPLVWTGSQLLAADAKVTIDDEALFRHQSLPRVEEKTASEQEAAAMGLSYVQLDGNIAVMANGAGITMATLDTLQYYGGSPANFLDAGGGASVEATARALELLLAAKPRAIIINIFGGITRCDDVARAFLQVKESREIPVPVVIRLVGTNEEVGVKLLADAGIGAYRTMHEAAARVVELARGQE